MWDPGHHLVVIMLWHFEQRWSVRFLQKQEVRRCECHMQSLAHLFVCTTLWHTPCVLSSSLLSAPLPYLCFWIYAFPIKLSSLHCLTFCNHFCPCRNLIPSHSHLSNPSQSISSSAPLSILFYFLAWLIAQTGLILRRTACKVSFTTTTMSPPIPSIYVHWLSHIARR